jgi:electron transport complex protein RnfB
VTRVVNAGVDHVVSRIARDGRDLIDAIDAVLPQTQCTQCGYEGCRPYAEAIAAGHAEINQCPPGGDAGIVKLALVTSRAPVPLNKTHGVTKPLALAVIDEAICIGCTLCIQACPVDAIVGGAKRMHDVVAELCTGCELCLPPCPVDCITMVDAGFEWNGRHAATARIRHRDRSERLARLAFEAASKMKPAEREVTQSTNASRKQAIVEAAVERARVLRERRDEALRVLATGEPR